MNTDSLGRVRWTRARSEEHTSELQSLRHLVCRLLLEKKNKITHHAKEKCTRLHADSPRSEDMPYARSPIGLKFPFSITVPMCSRALALFFFFMNPAPPEIYPFPLQDALPI